MAFMSTYLNKGKYMVELISNNSFSSTYWVFEHFTEEKESGFLCLDTVPYIEPYVDTPRKALNYVLKHKEEH